MVVLLLWSCENEEEINYFSNSPKVSHISYKDFKTKESFSNIINNIENKYFSSLKEIYKNNFVGKNVYATDSTFYIQTDLIYQTVNDSTTNYTFKIERPQLDSLKIENLIVSKNNFTNVIKLLVLEMKKDNEIFDTKLYSLNLDAINTDEFNFSKVYWSYGNAHQIPDCVEVSYATCGNGGGADGHADTGGNCGGSPATLDWSNCLPSFDEDGSSSGGGGRGVSTGTIPVGQGVGTFAITTTPVDVLGSLKRTLNLSPTSPEALWLDTHLIETGLIYDFLGNNPTQIQFALAAMDAWIQNSNTDVDFDDKIILDSTFVNNPRLKCVYVRFKDSTSNTISDYLENFLGEKPVAHLEFEADNLFKDTQNSEYYEAGAITSEPVNFLINITFNTDPRLPASASHMPTIILALEFIHEMVHAEMFRKLLSYAQEPNIPWTPFFIKSIKNDFGGLSDYYTRYWLELPPNQEPNQAQHQLMAQHYRTMIVAAIKDFDKSQHTDSFYEAISWIGLKGTGTIDPLTGLPENATEAWKGLTTPQRTNINTIISNAIQNETHNCN